MSMDSIIATEKNDDQIKSYLLFRLRNLFIFSFPVVLIINFFYESNASPWFLLTLAYLLKSFEGFTFLLEVCITEINLFQKQI